MLIKYTVLKAIARGEVSCVYRRWKQPRVRQGSLLRTAVGVLEVVMVQPCDPDEITSHDARHAGFGSPDELRDALGGSEHDPLFRIELRFAGPDPREELRTQAVLSGEEAADLLAQLDRMDRSARHGPWTRQVMTVIAARPGAPARSLAADVGMERDAFKRQVRKLKELGLTESLEVGYRLSPRGQTLAERLWSPQHGPKG